MWQVGCDEVILRPGDRLHIPRRVAHRFHNPQQTPARFVSIYEPGVVDPEFFRELAQAAGLEGPVRTLAMGDVLSRFRTIPGGGRLSRNAVRGSGLSQTRPKSRRTLDAPNMKALVLTAAVLALTMKPTDLSAQRMAADGGVQTFQMLADQYFTNAFFQYNPTAGTQAGLHEYDSKLENYSAASVQRQVAALRSYEAKINAIDAASLDAPVAADREILLNSIRSQLLSLETIRNWEKNPDNYSSGITGSIFVLMERPFAPVDERLRSAIARERQMPAVLAEARKNLRNPPRIFTEIALEQIDGIVSFFQNDVPSAFADATGCQAQGGVRADQWRGDRRPEELRRVDEERRAPAVQR